MSDIVETELCEKTNNVIPKSIANPAWADVMQKILKSKKPKKKKSLVLSKAKKLQDVLKEKQEDEGDERKEENESTAKVVAKVTDGPKQKIDSQHKRRRKDVALGIRVKPSILNREYERTLQRIATKGVVQLFNAVRQQQTVISRKLDEAGPLERKREKVYKEVDKRAFLDVLMGGSKSIPINNEVKPEKSTEKEENETKLWNVLRDDFVMGAKLKDWDKKNEDSEDSSAPEEMESDG